MTARAGDVLAAAAATDLALGTTARSVIAGYDGIFRSRQLEENRFSRAVVSFFPNNGVGRAWAELGATRWPGELLETRVLAKQLQASSLRADSCHSKHLALHLICDSMCFDTLERKSVPTKCTFLGYLLI